MVNSGSEGTERYTYTCDSNGNQIRGTKETYIRSWTQVERWTCTNNIRDLLTQVEKCTGKA